MKNIEFLLLFFFNHSIQLKCSQLLICFCKKNSPQYLTSKFIFSYTLIENYAMGMGETTITFFMRILFCFAFSICKTSVFDLNSFIGVLYFFMFNLLHTFYCGRLICLLNFNGAIYNHFDFGGRFFSKLLYIFMILILNKNVIKIIVFFKH